MIGVGKKKKKRKEKYTKRTNAYLQLEKVGNLGSSLPGNIGILEGNIGIWRETLEFGGKLHFFVHKNIKNCVQIWRLACQEINIFFIR